MKKFAIKMGILFTVILIALVLFLQFIGIEITGNIIYLVLSLTLFYSLIMYMYHKNRIIHSGHKFFLITSFVFILSISLFMGSINYDFVHPQTMENVEYEKLWYIDENPQKILVGMAIVTLILTIIILKQMISNAPRL